MRSTRRPSGRSCCSAASRAAADGVRQHRGGRRAFRAGGSIGELVAAFIAQYLNRAAARIVLLTLLSLAILLTTQVSLGRAFGAGLAFGGAGFRRAVRAFREWRENRRKEGQRREIIAKHAQEGRRHARRAARASTAAGRRPSPSPRPRAPVRASPRHRLSKPSRSAERSTRARRHASAAPRRQRRRRGPRADRAEAGRLHAAAARAARRAEDRTEDRRARADGRRAAARGEVPGVLGRRDRSCRFIRDRSSRRTSSSRTPA